MNKKVFFILEHHNSDTQDFSAAIVYWYGVLDRMGYDVTYINYSEYNVDNFYNLALQEKPYMIVFVNYFKTIHTEFYRLRQFSKVFLLQTDMHRFYNEHVKLWIPFVDGIINYEGTKEWCLKDGLSENGFLRMKWGFNPNMMMTESKPKKHKICFYGGLHGDRRLLLEQFKSKTDVIIADQTSTYEQIKTMMAESYFSLNLSWNAPMTRRELKGRVIEIPAHCVLLSEQAPELETYYNDDEYILFTSVEDAINKINSLTKQQIEEIYQKGKKALLEKNTAYHEWNKILPLMDPDFKPLDVQEILKTYHGQLFS